MDTLQTVRIDQTVVVVVAVDGRSSSRSSSSSSSSSSNSSSSSSSCCKQFKIREPIGIWGVAHIYIYLYIYTHVHTYIHILGSHIPKLKSIISTLEKDYEEVGIETAEGQETSKLAHVRMPFRFLEALAGCEVVGFILRLRLA